jgi:hypothetical protein
MPAKPASKLSRAIPAAYHAEVQRLRSGRNPDTGVTWTSREVAAYLGATHGLRCSHMAVIRLEAALSERGDALVIEALRGTMLEAVGPQVGRLKRAAKRLDAKLRTEKNTQKVAAGVRAQATTLDTLAKISGVAKPITVDVSTGGQPLPDAYALLSAAMARLAEEPAAGGASEADPKPPA